MYRPGLASTQPRDIPTPRAGEAPPRVVARASSRAVAETVIASRKNPANRAKTWEQIAREQQAIADAVDGIIP